MKIRALPSTNVEQDFKVGDIVTTTTPAHDKGNYCILLAIESDGKFRYMQLRTNEKYIRTGTAKFLPRLWRRYDGELILSNDKE